MSGDGSGDDIMERLLAIGEEMRDAGDFKIAVRDDVEIGDVDLSEILPGFNLLEGEEEGNAPVVARPERSAGDTPMRMFPLVCIAAEAPRAEIAGVIRLLRRKVVRKVMTDAQLQAVIGKPGGIAYRGFVADFVATKKILGRMVLRFEIAYQLAPASL